MEFCELGDLHLYVQRKTVEGSPMSVSKKAEIMLEVVHGMTYLHSKNIIHRDLKPANILLDASEHAKIMDFGISRTITQTSKMTSRVGTNIYMAPEIVLGREYGKPVDVFSLGIMLFEILTETWHPYGIEAETHGAVEFKVANDPEYRPGLKPYASELSPTLMSLIQACWTHEPSERPTFAEIRDRLGEGAAQQVRKVDLKAKVRSQGGDQSSILSELSGIVDPSLLAGVEDVLGEN